ncbi:MAG: hypothetical protein OSB70_15700, partial [Myxococcota bacterium]|nr:hypothetical protein [Myxococcota bacterium]
GHPATSARGTEAAALARERDQAVVTTRVAVNAQEAMREHAAAQEGAKLLLDEARGRLLPACGAREETFELLADDSMKESLLGFMAFVLGHMAPNRDRRGGAPRGG